MATKNTVMSINKDEVKTIIKEWLLDKIGNNEIIDSIDMDNENITVYTSENDDMPF